MITRQLTLDDIQLEPHFDGRTFESAFDHDRLTGLLARVYEVMADGKWRTLQEIKSAVGNSSDASISARLRDLRKGRFGAHTVNRRSRGERGHGLFEYQLELNA